jgi:hypothetical protein
LPTEYIKTEVPVGESTDLQVTFRVPDRPGRYILAVLPMRPPDFFLTTHPVTRSEDAVFIGVTVTGGRAVMIDLQDKFDTDAVSYENAPRDGDVDGLGGTFPGEWFPADRYGINAGQQFFPSGYASDISSEIVRSTSFKFGSTAPGAKNALSGKGQRIDVPVNKYVALHIAAVVIGGASLNGGIGSIGGSLMGALLMAVLRNGTNQLGWDSYIQEIIIGAVIVMAVGLDKWRQGRAH